MAKTVSFPRFSVIFDLDLRRNSTEEKSNEACLVGNKGVLLFQTSHAVMPKTMLFAAVFGQLEFDKKKEKTKI